MKLLTGILALSFLLMGCKPDDANLDRAMELRKNILESKTCSFDAGITAEYTDDVYMFAVSCVADSSGALKFTVTEPESISGITGSISDNGASLTFDDQVLAFPMLADGQVTPVSTPWLFLKTLRSGYISGCAETDEGLLLSMDDSYEEYPLHLEIQIDHESIPVYAEIYWNQKRVISLDIKNFTLQ